MALNSVAVTTRPVNRSGEKNRHRIRQVVKETDASKFLGSFQTRSFRIESNLIGKRGGWPRTVSNRTVTRALNRPHAATGPRVRTIPDLCGWEAFAIRSGFRSLFDGVPDPRSPDTTRLPRLPARPGSDTLSYFFESTAARNRSSDSTSAGSATVSAISWRNRSRYLFRSL